MMKQTLVIFIIIIYSTINVSAMEKKQNIVAVYGFTQHTDPDGRPSRNDRRYYKHSLCLYDDYTFKLTEQQGRLSPSYETMTGTWKIKDNQLILSITEKTYTDYNDKEIKETYTDKRIFKKASIYSLSCYNKEWEHQHGLRPDGLFEKYNK